MSGLWHPRAIGAPANRDSGPFIGVAPKIVLHTVEGRGSYSYNPSSYYGNPYWPHATIAAAGIYQHLPIDVFAFALANASGGVETNRANAIQCEILWFAAEIVDLPDAILRHVADWVGWVAEQTGTPLDFAEFRGAGSAGEDAPQRFGGQEWIEFSGVCGHQHVPENDHWDPGAFPVDRLRSLLGSAAPPIPSEEDSMVLSHVVVRPGESLTIPVPVPKGGFGWKRATVAWSAPHPGTTFRGVIGPNWRPIAGDGEHIEAMHVAYLDLSEGDEELQVSVPAKSNGGLAVTFRIEAA